MCGGAAWCRSVVRTDEQLHDQPPQHPGECCDGEPCRQLLTPLLLLPGHLSTSLTRTAPSRQTGEPVRNGRQRCGRPACGRGARPRTSPLRGPGAGFLCIRARSCSGGGSFHGRPVREHLGIRRAQPTRVRGAVLGVGGWIGPCPCPWSVCVPEPVCVCGFGVARGRGLGCARPRPRSRRRPSLTSTSAVLDLGVGRRCLRPRAEPARLRFRAGQLALLADDLLAPAAGCRDELQEARGR